MKVERTEGARSRAAAVEALSEVGRAFGILSEAVPEFRSGAWRLLEYEVLEARQKFGRSIMLSRISYEEKDSGRVARAEMGVKLYGRKSDGALPGLRRLWEAGFAPPGEYRVPRPFGYSLEYHALFQGWVQTKT